MTDVNGMDTAGAVAVDVYPDARRFGARTRREVLPEAERIGREIAERIAGPIAEQVARQVRDGVRAGQRLAQDAAVRAGADIGATIGREITRKVGQALRTLPKAQVDADVSAALRKIDLLEQRLTRMRVRKDVVIGAETDEASRKLALIEQRIRGLNQRTVVRVGADIGEAAEQLFGLEAIAADIDGRVINVQVDVDVQGATAELVTILSLIEAIDGRDVDVDVDVNSGAAVAQMAALNSAAHGTSGGIRGIIVAALALAPVIVPAAAAATAAIGAIGVAAIAGGAAIGTMVLGLVGVVGAVQAMSAAEDQAASGAASLAGQQAAVASATDGVRSAVAALANTRANADEQQRRALTQLADAQRTLTRAEDEALRVREDLSRAQESARRALEDLNADVEQNAISQRQANLDVKEAKAALDKVLADPKATQDQREQAEITYQRAVLQLEDLQRRGRRLAQDADAANKAGVEGSDQVQAARERIAAADERVAEAQRSVAEARLAQQNQERQSAFQIAQAQQAVIQAQRALETATVRAGVGGSSAMNKLRESMAALSPEGRRFALFIFGLRDEIGGLRRAAEAGLLPGMQRGIELILPHLPKLERFIYAVAVALGRMFENGVRAFQDPFWQQFFGYIGDVAVPALEGMAKGFGNIIKGVAGLILGFRGVTDDVGGGILELTQRFADWATTLDTNRGFQTFLAYIRDVGPDVVATLGLLIRAAFRLLQAMAPIGAVVQAGLGLLAKVILALPLDVLTALIGAVLAVVVGLKLLAAVMAIVNLVMAANPIVLVVLALAALVVGLIVAYRESEQFRKIVDAALNGIAVAAQWLWNNVLKPIFDLWAWYYGQVVGPAVMWLWREVITPAFDGISKAISWWWNNVTLPIFEALRFWVMEVTVPVILFLWKNAVQPAFQGIELIIRGAWAAIQIIFGLIRIYVQEVLAPLWTWLWRKVIQPAFEGIGQAISWTWNRVIKPVFEILGGFIKDKVVPAFQAGLDAVSKSWETLRDIAKRPVKFVVETVINGGIIKAYNWLAEKFGVNTVEPVKLPAGFATGGRVAGPGTETSDSIPALLSNDEHVWAAAEVRGAGGHGVMERLRGMARAGLLHSLLPGFRHGGHLEGRTPGTGDGLGDLWRRAKEKAGDVVEGLIGSTLELLKDPVGQLTKLADRLVANMPGRDTEVGKIVTSVPKRLAREAANEIKEFFTSNEGAAGLPGGGSLGGSAGMMAILRAVFPGLQLISGFRPGAITATGRPSYHGSDRAVDIPPRADVFAWIRARFPNSRELIFSPMGPLQVWNGRPHVYTGITRAMHFDHVHWAYDGGGYLPEGVTPVFNGTGGPEPVLTDAQWQDIHSLAMANAAQGRGGGDGSRALVDIENFYAGDSSPDEIAAELDWRSRGLG